MKNLGIVVYGAVFCIAVPVLVVLGCRSIDPVITIPLPELPDWPGRVLTILGAAIAAIAMLELRRRGGGLPMNGFPPVRFVTGGVYALMPHPIYVGAVILCAGLSLVFASAPGLYVFTPLVAAGCAAIVWGYERPDLFRRFGRCGGVTLFGIPPMNGDPIPPFRRVAAGLVPLLAAWHGIFTLPLMTVHLAVYVLLLTRKTNREACGFQLKWLAASLLATLGMFSFPADYAVWLAVGCDLLVLLFGGNILLSALMASERLANSWRAWRIGPLRIIDHAVFSFLAAGAGFYLTGVLTGGKSLTALCVAASCSLAGGALWAQVAEGSKKMLRPFGFYGAIFGAMLGLLAAGCFTPAREVWILFAALAVSTPWVQSIGRLRCMVQGCCHGKPVESPDFHRYGIRHVHPSSRVCKFTGFTGVPVHATALYAIAFNLIIGWILAILWLRGTAAGVVIGLYFAMTGFARFVEEAWRGEPQIRRFLRLTEYQWLCAAFELIAFGIWAMPASMAAPPAPVWDYPNALAASLAAGLIYAFAMSMDFPESDMRFSRLTG